MNALLPQPPAPLIGGTSGVHLVLPLRPGGPQGALYTAAPEDGRPFFLLPWDGRLLVGTTDVRFTGHPDGAVVRERDVAYLLNATNALFPGASYMPEEIRWTTVGVRPLPISGKGAAAVTRRHFLVDHERREGIPGLASLVGGKLTTYRSLAEKAVQWVERALGRPPGPSGRTSPPARLSQEHSASGRLARLYGNRADAILKLARKEPAYGVPLAPDCPAALAEAIHAVDQEGARTAEDVILRRLVLLPPRPEWLAAAETVVQDRSGAGRPASGGR
ncbi:MAG: hypothetical protein FJX77_04395 [Armatimonadetes bacterium]|nr:hypothetical protein [Armatimonadota bacterium]